MPGYLIKTANFVAEISNDEELSHLAEVETIQKDTMICPLPGNTWIEAKKLPILRKVWGLDSSANVPPPILTSGDASTSAIKSKLPPSLKTVVAANPYYNPNLAPETSDYDSDMDSENCIPPEPPASECGLESGVQELLSSDIEVFEAGDEVDMAESQEYDDSEPEIADETRVSCRFTETNNIHQDEVVNQPASNEQHASSSINDTPSEDSSYPVSQDNNEDIESKSRALFERMKMMSFEEVPEAAPDESTYVIESNRVEDEADKVSKTDEEPENIEISVPDSDEVDVQPFLKVPNAVDPLLQQPLSSVSEDYITLGMVNKATNTVRGLKPVDPSNLRMPTINGTNRREDTVRGISAIPKPTSPHKTVSGIPAFRTNIACSDPLSIRPFLPGMKAPSPVSESSSLSSNNDRAFSDDNLSFEIQNTPENNSLNYFGEPDFFKDLDNCSQELSVIADCRELLGKLDDEEQFIHADPERVRHNSFTFPVIEVNETKTETPSAISDALKDPAELSVVQDTLDSSKFSDHSDNKPDNEVSSALQNETINEVSSALLSDITASVPFSAQVEVTEPVSEQEDASHLEEISASSAGNENIQPSEISTNDETSTPSEVQTESISEIQTESAPNMLNETAPEALNEATPEAFNEVAPEALCETVQESIQESQNVNNIQLGQTADLAISALENAATENALLMDSPETSEETPKETDSFSMLENAGVESTTAASADNSSILDNASSVSETQPSQLATETLDLTINVDNSNQNVSAEVNEVVDSVANVPEIPEGVSPEMLETTEYYRDSSSPDAAFVKQQPTSTSIEQTASPTESTVLLQSPISNDDTPVFRASNEETVQIQALEAPTKSHPISPKDLSEEAAESLFADIRNQIQSSDSNAQTAPLENQADEDQTSQTKNRVRSRRISHRTHNSRCSSANVRELQRFREMADINTNKTATENTTDITSESDETFTAKNTIGLAQTAALEQDLTCKLSSPDQLQTRISPNAVQQPATVIEGNVPAGENDTTLSMDPIYNASENDETISMEACRQQSKAQDSQAVQDEFKTARAAVEAAIRAASKDGQVDNQLLRSAFSFVDAIDKTGKTQKPSDDDDENPSDIFRIRDRRALKIEKEDENNTTLTHKCQSDLQQNVIPDDDISSDHLTVRGRSELRRMLAAEEKAAENNSIQSVEAVTTEDYCRKSGGELRKLFEEHDELHLILANDVREKELEVAKEQKDAADDANAKSDVIEDSLMSSMPVRNKVIVAAPKHRTVAEPTKITAAYREPSSNKQVQIANKFVEEKLYQDEVQLAEFDNLYLTSQRIFAIDVKDDIVVNYEAFDIDGIQSFGIHEERRVFFLVFNVILIAMFVILFFSDKNITLSMQSSLFNLQFERSYLWLALLVFSVIITPLSYKMSFRKVMQFNCSSGRVIKTHCIISKDNRESAMEFLNRFDTARVECRAQKRK